MKNKVLKQMLAFSLAVALVGGNSVATFAAEPTNGTESSANTQAATDATAEASRSLLIWTKRKDIFLIFRIKIHLHREIGKKQDYAITDFPSS